MKTKKNYSKIWNELKSTANQLNYDPSDLQDLVENYISFFGGDENFFGGFNKKKNSESEDKLRWLIMNLLKSNKGKKMLDVLKDTYYSNNPLFEHYMER